MNLAKKLFCVLLAVLMLGSLSALAVSDAPEEAVEAPAEEILEVPAEEIAEAPAEEPVEAPIEEPIEAPVEEPDEEPDEAPIEEPVPDIDEPAQDGVDVSSGSHLISQFAPDVSLTLKGDATIVVDRDQTIKSISGGSYALTLTVQSGKTLTISNSGHGIEVKSLTINGPGTLKVTSSSKDALNVDQSVVINSGTVELYSNWDGIFSRNSSVTINGGMVRIIAGEDSIDAKGSISIKSGAGFFGSGDEQGIYTRNGSITLAGNVASYAGHCAVYAPAGQIDSSAKLTATSSGSSESTDNYALKANGLIALRSQDGSYLKATGAYGGVWSVNGNIAVYSDTEVSADYDAAYRADKGNVVFFYGTHTAKGGVKGYGPYCMNSGVYGQAVTVASTATMDASGSFAGITGTQQVTINGNTTAAATRSSNTSYGTTTGIFSKAIAINAPLTASGKNFALQASDSLTIDSAYAIITPSAGKLGTYSSYKTVVNTAGGAVTSVVIAESVPAVTTVRVTYDANGGYFTVRGQKQSTFIVNTTVGQRYDSAMSMTPTREGYSFIGWYTAASGGSSTGGSRICTQTTNHTIYAHWAKNPVADDVTVKISADGKSAQVTGDFDGLYARIALVLQNGSTSGLYVTQGTINSTGEIVVPTFMVPGLTVKGVNIALVPTLADISSPQPNVVASDFKML